MNLEEKFQRYKNLSNQIESLEMEKKELGLQILHEMPEKTIQTDTYCAKRCDRLTIKTSIEQARLFNATKMIETVDKEKIKELYALGQSVPGISHIQYLQLSCLRTKEAGSLRSHQNEKD